MTRDAHLAFERCGTESQRGTRSREVMVERMLKRPVVAQRIMQLEKRAADVVGMDAGKVALMALEWASVSAADVVDIKTGRLRQNVAPAALRAVQQITINKNGDVVITMPDRVRSLSLAAEIMGLKRSADDVPTALREIFELFNRAQAIEQSKPLLPSLRGEVIEG